MTQEPLADQTPGECRHPTCHCGVENGQWCSTHCQETDQRAEFCGCKHDACEHKFDHCDNAVVTRQDS